MAQAQIIGRFEWVEYQQRRWVLDVAHNVAAAQFLLQRMATGKPSERPDQVRAVVCGMLADKHHAEFVAAVAGQVNAPWFMLDTEGERGYSAAAMVAAAAEVGVSGESSQDMQSVVEKVLSCTSPQDVILCLGSFNLIEQFHQYSAS